MFISWSRQRIDFCDKNANRENQLFSWFERIGNIGELRGFRKCTAFPK